jgi:hypothetical protein
VGRLAADEARIATDVAADIGTTTSSHAATAIVRRLLKVVAGGRRIGAAEVRRLRAEGAEAARAGQPLARPIDAWLSAAWVTWDRAIAIARPDEGSELAVLGSGLLRAGDDIAAALADGYTAAEQALSRSAGAATQAVLDELLTPGQRDAPAIARLARRAALTGLEPNERYHVLVLRQRSELTSDSEPIHELGRRLARDPERRDHLVAARSGDLVAIASGVWPDGGPFEGHLTDFPFEDWWAVTAGPASIDQLANTYAEALDGLRVARAAVAPRLIARATDLALERAVVADPALAASGADRWLEPLASAGRGSSALLPTLQAWLDSGQSIVATARSLGVAARTVSYRLERIARLLGAPTLGARECERLTTALLVRRLLGQ